MPGPTRGAERDAIPCQQLMLHYQLQIDHRGDVTGVEALVQRDFLARYGYSAYQGYFFSRPLTLTELEKFVQRRSHAAPCDHHQRRLHS